MRTKGQCFQQTPNTLNATLQLKKSEALKGHGETPYRRPDCKTFDE